jgi:hypothetical protein
MPQHLTDIELDEVSLVDKGANQHSHVILMKAETKREGGKDYPKADFAYTPGSASTWKLRLTSTPGGDPDRRIVGAAIAALGPGYRGQKVQIPAADLAAVKRRVLSAWLKANPDKTRADAPAAIKKADDAEVDTILGALTTAVAKAMTFRDVMNEDVVEDKLEEMMEAFARSIHSIMGDPEITNRSAAVAESAAQFHAAVAALSKEYDMSNSHEELMQKIAKLEEDNTALAEANAKLTEDLEAATTPDTSEQEIDKAALPESVRKALEEGEALRKRAEEQEARIAKMEDETARKEWIGKCATPAEGELLHRVAKHDGALADEVHAVIKTLTAQLETAGLFNEIGKSGDAAVETGEEKINKAATKYAEEHGVSKAVAVTKVLELHPELYAEHRAH